MKSLAIAIALGAMLMKPLLDFNSRKKIDQMTSSSDSNPLFKCNLLMSLFIPSGKIT